MYFNFDGPHVLTLQHTHSQAIFSTRVRVNEALSPLSSPSLPAYNLVTLGDPASQGCLPGLFEALMSGQGLGNGMVRRRCAGGQNIWLPDYLLREYLVNRTLLFLN